MQYILTQDEFDKLNEKRVEATLKATKKLQQLCTKIADTMPVKSWKGNEPWGCIITEYDKGNEWYCDACPVESICPREHKEFSQ